MRRRVEGQYAGVGREIVISEIAELKAELQRMCSTDIIQRVSNHSSKVSASLRKVSFGTEQQPGLVCDRDHRNERHVWAKYSPQTHRSRIGRIIRCECDVNSVRAQAKFIDNGWAENVSLAQGKDLPTACASVTKAR